MMISPWINRGKGVYDNSTKTFRGEWDSGMAFALQGLLQSKSSAQLEQEVDGGTACVNARLPVHATELTKVAWQSSCLEWDSLQQYYFGTQATHHTQTHHFGNSSDGIGKVTFRRDGFVGFSHLSGQIERGNATKASHSVLVTAPFQLPVGCGASAELVLLINVNVSTGGRVRVGFSRVATSDDDDTDASNSSKELADVDTVGRFVLGASDTITTSSVRAVASWGGSSALTDLQQANVVVSMTVYLQQAEVYSWEWRCINVSRSWTEILTCFCNVLI